MKAEYRELVCEGYERDPQGLKPASLADLSGTAKAVPSQNRVLQSALEQLITAIDHPSIHHARLRGEFVGTRWAFGVDVQDLVSMRHQPV